MFVELTQEYLGTPIGKRIDVDEKDAQRLIAHGQARAVSDDLLTPAVSQAVDGAFQKFTQALDGIVSNSLKQFADAQKKSLKNAVPILFGPDGEGDPKKCFGDFCLAVSRNDRGYLEKNYGSVWSSWHTKAAMGESAGATGGYVVPPDFYEQLLAIIEESAFIRPRAFVQPMASASLQFPYLDVTTAQSAGVTPFFGGVQMTWTAEAQTRTETEPAFKMLELKAYELSGYSVSSNVLLQDSAVNLEKFLFALFGRAIAWYEEYAFLQGNGVGKPMGMLNAPAVINVTRGTSNQVGFADMANMWSKLLPFSTDKAIWAFSPSVVPQLLQLKDGANRAIFISIDQGATKSPTWSLLGRPAIMTEKLPPLGTRGDLVLIDPSLYVIGDRQQIEIAASEHVNFLKNQMTWRVVERVDGQPWIDKPITLQDGSSQVSPFVVLN
jgi:HK97 family phage major capsid protein